MIISKKPYWSLGSIFILVLGFALWQEQSAKDTSNKAADLVQAVYKFDQARMQNRLRVRNYLLAGDPREATELKDGGIQIYELINAAEQRTAELEAALGHEKNDLPRQSLEQLRDLEITWTREFAEPLVQRRLKYDAGGSSAAELSLAYMQADPEKWKIREAGPLADLVSLVQAMNKRSRTSAENAGIVTWTLVIAGLFLFLLIGTIGARSSP